MDGVVETDCGAGCIGTMGAIAGTIGKTPEKGMVGMVGVLIPSDGVLAGRLGKPVVVTGLTELGISGICGNEPSGSIA